jgi:glycosidase
MQWDDSPNAGFSDAEETYLPVIDDEEYGYHRVNVAAQEEDPNSYLAATRFLLKARRATKELRSGEMAWYPAESAAVLAFWRILGDQRTLCLFNLDNQPHSLSLDLRDYQGRRLVDLLAEGEEREIAGWPAVINLRPFAAHWLRIQ